jgi:hypothetical protein
MTLSGGFVEFTFQGVKGFEGDTGFDSIAAGADGNLWFTAKYDNFIGRITPSGHVTTNPVRTGAFVRSDFSTTSLPTSITRGPDCNMWFTETGGGDVQGTFTPKIGRIKPDGTITEYKLPVPSSQNNNTAYPIGMVVGADGNLWVTDAVGDDQGGSVWRVTPVCGDTSCPKPHCGDDHIDENEACDGKDLGGLTCNDLGYSGGALGCADDCTGFDVEKCAQGTADACNFPIKAKVGSMKGDTTWGTRVGTATCGGAGGEVVYTFTPAKTGDLTVTLAAQAALTVSARTACKDDKTELGCTAVGGTSAVLHVAVTSSTPIFITVDGSTSSAAGPYTLTLAL